MTAHTGDQPQTTAIIGMQDQMREEFIKIIYESQWPMQKSVLKNEISGPGSY